MSLEWLLVPTFWLGSDRSGTFSLHFAQSSYDELERPAWLENAHSWWRTDICSCKISAKVSLISDNPFLVPSLCKLNHISVCFIQISTKSPGNSLFPSGKAIFFFWSHPQCFGPLGKVQHNINISIKTSSVSRLSVSYDYGLTKFLPPMTSIWLNYINSFWLFRNCINCINRVSLWENT